MPVCKRWCGRCQGGQYRYALAHQDQHTGQQAASNAAEPTHAAAAQHEIPQGLLAGALGDPQQLGAGHSADDSCDRGIQRVRRQPRPAQFAAEDPQTYQRSNRDKDAEACDLKRADTKKNG